MQAARPPPAGLLGDLRGCCRHDAGDLHLACERVDHLPQPAGQVLQRSQQQLTRGSGQVSELVQVLQAGQTAESVVAWGQRLHGCLQE